LAFNRKKKASNKSGHIFQLKKTEENIKFPIDD